MLSGDFAHLRVYEHDQKGFINMCIVNLQFLVQVYELEIKKNKYMIYMYLRNATICACFV